MGCGLRALLRVRRVPALSEHALGSHVAACAFSLRMLLARTWPRPRHCARSVPHWASLARPGAPGGGRAGPLRGLLRRAVGTFSGRGRVHRPRAAVEADRWPAPAGGARACAEAGGSGGPRTCRGLRPPADPAGLAWRASAFPTGCPRAAARPALGCTPGRGARSCASCPLEDPWLRLRRPPRSAAPAAGHTLLCGAARVVPPLEKDSVRRRRPEAAGNGWLRTSGAGDPRAEPSAGPSPRDLVTGSLIAQTRCWEPVR